MKKINCILLIAGLTVFKTTAQEQIILKVNPEIVYTEQGENKQFLNFDFLLKNTTSDTLTLNKLTVNVYDGSNRLIHSRFLDGNGTAPSMQIIPNRVLAPSQSQLIFNPINEFNRDLPLDKIEYELTFGNGKDEEFVVRKNIKPQKATRKPYVFPLKGKVLVYDGHDFYAHHRRFDYEFAPIKQLGISANFMRYAYDFVLLDASNKSFVGTAGKDEDYYGYGKPVYAVGAGKVIYASNKHKDDKTFDVPGIANNPLELYGNCIAIQHDDNSVSVYGHLRQNSLKVKIGDLVKAKQEIAAIGVSGSSFFPHLHFELRTGIKSSSEGIPSCFSNVYHMESGKKTKHQSGLAETGAVLLAE